MNFLAKETKIKIVEAARELVASKEEQYCCCAINTVTTNMLYQHYNGTDDVPEFWAVRDELKGWIELQINGYVTVDSFLFTGKLWGDLTQEQHDQALQFRLKMMDNLLAYVQGQE